MASKHSNDGRAILQRIRTLVPGINDAVEAVQAEHDITKRILARMVLAHATLVDLEETINQALANSASMAAAQEILVRDQRTSMDELEELADRTASARTVINNLDVWFQSDPASIAHVLEIVDLPQLATAALMLSRERLMNIIETLQGIE